jgi:hypothetical protein
MKPAQRIVGKFGGQTVLARLLGKGPSTVQHWTKTGSIPAKWHSTVLALAQEQGLDLSPRDFIETTEDDQAPATSNRPEAKWQGFLTVGDREVPVYVLDDGRRVISRTGATGVLVGPQGGGNLESYLRVSSIRRYVPPALHGQFIEFTLPGVTNKVVLGMNAETFLDVCRAYLQARNEGALSTESQISIAINAAAFLAACAKIGLLALIDEATGYQYERSQDALRLKLKLFLEDEIREWEKTFPDELWKEFGRLTNWRGPLRERPKYWGQLVMELVYGYLDPDVAEYLKKEKPKPQHGQNYHQWLSSQYGLKRLIEHIWMLIGMASACQTMPELRTRMAEKYGRVPVQLTYFVSPDLPKPPVRNRALPESSPGTAPAVTQQTMALLEYEFGPAASL